VAVYGYCRVSTERQADEGESLEVQRRKLEGYAMQQGWTLDRVFVERGVSGSRPLDERAEGQKLLAAVEPRDVIITSKLDRMFRSALDALRVLDALKRRDISLHMIDLGGDVTVGWRLGEDGALIEVPEQQAAIRRMVEMRRAGLSLRAIADAMKAEGFELSHVGVKKVIAAAEDRQKQEAA
jgi:DNA invertase Pin-like site-specific DNA recombinase